MERHPAGPPRPTPAARTGIWFTAGSTMPASRSSSMCVMFQLDTPTARAPPDAQMDTMARHVLRRHSRSLKVGAVLLHAGSELCVTLLVTLPCDFSNHG